jgi:signal transduction histidine kinase
MLIAGMLPVAFREPLTGVGLACVVVAVITLVLVPIGTLDPGVSSGVLYVLGVLLVAGHSGLWVGVLAAVLSALALNLFHAEPLDQRHGKTAGDYVALGVLLGTAIVASEIAARARLRAIDAEQRLRLEEELRTREAERIRLEELRVSRARMLKAADDERRRVARDLHDGAQQRLVHTVVTLRLAQLRLRQGSDGVRALVDEALEHAEQATSELRELAHGILPAVLTRGGLKAGVSALASRMQVPVDTDVTPERFPEPVEATAYFVLAEALTNVAKHARAGRAAIVVTSGEGRLELQVRDDGVGGATEDGSGLLGMRDRLAALDGRLRIESPPGGGTLVAATIPIS